MMVLMNKNDGSLKSLYKKSMEVKLEKLTLKNNQEPLKQPHPLLKSQNTPKYQIS